MTEAPAKKWHELSVFAFQRPDASSNRYKAEIKRRFFGTLLLAFNPLEWRLAFPSPKSF
jgi:hypothetical protein